MSHSSFSSPSAICIDANTSATWLMCQGSNLVLIDNELPQGLAQDYQLANCHALHLGEWRGSPLYLVLDDPQPRQYQSLRTQLFLPEAEFNLLNRGIALKHFLDSHKFCGNCGEAVQLAQEEWALQCQNAECRQRLYPIMCPSIIVAVRRGKQILLANHVRHKDSKMYTTLAGFVELGESFEQAVVREVFEETGISIQNLRYFGSQPWSFPNSMMVGFLADYASGEIHLQEAEIHDARWFSADQPMPELPPEGTIARKLIQASLELCKIAEA